LTFDHRQVLKQPKEVANNDRIDSQLRQIQEKLDQLERQGRMVFFN